MSSAQAGQSATRRLIKKRRWISTAQLRNNAHVNNLITRVGGLKQMRKYLVCLVSLLLIFSFVLSACAPAAPSAPTAVVQPTQQPPTAPPAGPKRGGTLKWSTGASPQNLDIWQSVANQDMWSMVNVVEGLVRVNKKGDDMEACVADKWTISDDGLEYTFHIRPGIKFSNGDPVTPEDVVFSLKYAMVTGPWKWLDTSIKDVVKVDDSDVKITLTQKYAPMLTVFGFVSNSIISQKVFESKGLDEFNKAPIGTGPFLIKDYIPNDHITLARNPNYWDMGEDGKPLPYLDEIIVTQVPEPTTRVLQVQSGQMDATDGVNWSQVNDLKKDATALMQLWPSTQTWYLLFNLKFPPMDDKNFRLALSYATDRQAMVDAVLFGNGSVATTFFPEEGMCVDKSIMGFSYDLEKAKQYLNQSKYATGFKGFKIEVPSGGGMARDIATMLKDMWAKLGVDVEVQEVENATLTDEFNSRTHFSISGYQWTNDILDPDEQVGFFVVDPAYNTSWANDQALKDAKDAQLTFDPSRRCQLYSDIQKIYNEDSPVLNLYHTPFNTFIKKDVKGYSMISLGWYRFQYVWLDR
jgi:peptide/nickel transport system substrate-binding protein